MEVETSVIATHIFQCLATVGRTVELYYTHKQLLWVGSRCRTYKVVISLTTVPVNNLHLLCWVGNGERRTAIGTFVEQCGATEVERTRL